MKPGSSRPPFVLILHPYMLALYAVLVPLANNIADIHLAGLRAMIFALAGALALVILLRITLKDSIKAGLLSSGIILLVSMYGHVERLVQSSITEKTGFSPAVFLMPIWLGVLGVYGYGVLRKWTHLERLSGYMNWFSLVLLVFPLYTLFNYNQQTEATKQWLPAYLQETWIDNGVASVAMENRQNIEGEKPDIYYIILDAYTRADILSDLYEYDMTGFIADLEERGFYTASASQANYTETEISIASSLNMSHINSAPDYFRQNASVDGPWIIPDVAAALIQQNRVADLLRAQGYTIVGMDSGYDETRLRSADEYVHPPAIEGSTSKQVIFEMLLLDTTIGRLFTQLRGGEVAPLQALFTAHRQRVLYTLEHVPDFASQDGDFFVFAHIICPHTPYIFGPNGEEIQSSDPYTLLDAHPGEPQNIGLYRDQVNYLNQLILEMVDEILARSDVPPVIILQGDHSSKVYRELHPPQETWMKLLFPIMNAYHLPDGGEDLLYPTITPVNTFRLVLNRYLGANLDLLPDTSYEFKVLRGKRQFIDVCQAYQYCAP